ncbi:MAG: O-antigen ligase [Hyphomicrobiales bacterium]|nr:O-antigen ligase [Hyphomicrobiales bacterium]
MNLAAVGGVLEVFRSAVRLTRDRYVLCLAVPIYLYCGAYLLALAANPSASWTYALPLATLLLFPFLYSSWSLSRHETVARAVVFGSAAACFGALALAIIQSHVLGMRAEGGDGNAIVFAVVTTLSALVSLAGIFGRPGMAATILFAAYCAGSIAVLYSGSRTAWLALFLASGATLSIYSGRRPAWNPTVAAVCAVAGLVAIIAVATFIVPTRIEALVHDWREINTDGNRDSSLGNRRELWKLAAGAISQQPILGHGPQATRQIIREGFARDGMTARYTHFHNGFLTAWVEAGIVGFLALIGILLAALWAAVRTLLAAPNDNQRLGAAILSVTAIAYAVNGSTAILLGHDILDAMFVAFLCVGAYLAAGTSALDTTKDA